MKITPIYQYNLRNTVLNQKQTTGNSEIIDPAKNLELPNYQVAFGANIFPRRFNVENAKNLLIKQFTEILKNDLSNVSEQDLRLRLMRKIAAFYSDKMKKVLDLRQESENFAVMKNNMNYEQAISMRNSILKRAKALQNSKPPSSVYDFKIPDEKYDFELINKFKTAILDENFDLVKVFKEYYAGLEDIKTLEELNKKYPKIKIPKTPQQVMAEKIETTFTKDFYMQMHELLEKRDYEGSFNLLNKMVEKAIEEVPDKKISMPKSEMVADLIDEVGNVFMAKYHNIRKNNYFSSLPEKRKVKKPLFSDTDLKLFSIDYEQYVLEVIKEQYINFKNPNDIVLDIADGTKIKISSIKEPDYKFEKIPAKIKQFLLDGIKLKTAQRDYDNFGQEELKSRLEFFSDRLGDNEELLNRIIEFATCRFEPEDRVLLAKFLRELDLVNDGDKTLKEALDDIYHQDLLPKGTHRLNELERRQTLEQMRNSQKLHAELKRQQNNFDDAINTLYQYNMPSVADICSKYRPTLPDDKVQCENVRQIIKIINNNITKNGFNSEKTEREITRWDKYTELKQSGNNPDILEKAQNYAKDKSGKIDINKAGKYIINSEIINCYPESLNFYRQPEILEKVMNVAGENKDLAVKYLCKYSDFIDLNTEERTHILKYIDSFDLRDTLDKIVLKGIIDDYIKVETKDLVKVTEKDNDAKESIIGSRAKKQILDHYKFPACIEYFKAFEEAMTQLATTKRTAGIKHLGINNAALEGIYELKIMGHDDRLFAYNGTYYFNEFSNKGLH